MLVKVGRAGEAKSNKMTAVKVRKEKRSNGASGRMAGSPFVESEDSVCRFLAFLHVLLIVDAKSYRGSKRPIRPLLAWFTLRNIFQYLGPGNCAQLLKLMLLFHLLLGSFDDHPLAGTHRPIAVEGTHNLHPSLCDLVSWGIAPENS